MSNTLTRTAGNSGKVFYPLARYLNMAGMGILVLMMFLTTADVTLRYIFNKPITGAMELTQFMMAILVAFGLAHTQVIRRHISVDLVLVKLPERVRAAFNTITSFFCLGIFGVIAWRSISYAQNLEGFTSASLFIPLSPFVLLVAIGAITICLIYIAHIAEYISQITERSRWMVSLGFFAIIAGFIVLFSTPIWPWAQTWDITPLAAGYIGIALLIIILFSGMSIGIVMAMIGFLGIAIIAGIKPALTTIGSTPYTTASSYSLSVIPLFVLMGSFCFYSEISKDLYNTVYKWIGHLPGGLAMATVGACAGFAAVSGSSVATVATIGTVAMPEMRRFNYDVKLAAGCIAAGGSIGILIPPSVILVIYAILTEQSIGKMFLAGFIPGVLEAVFYIITIYILCMRNPRLGPRGEKATLLERFTSFKGTWGVLALFILVIGGMYMGLFTPTEAAGVGAFGAFIFALGRRKINRKNFKESLLETGITTAMVFVILIGANILGYFLAITRLPFELSNFVANLDINRYFILGIIILIYIFLGAIMSSMAMIVLTVPIFFPVIVALGFDPIWFGIIIVRVVEVGQITPPVGINVFVMQGLAKEVPMYTIFKGIVPFLIADFCHIAMLIAVPQVATFLPNFID